MKYKYKKYTTIEKQSRRVKWWACFSIVRYRILPKTAKTIKYLSLPNKESLIFQIVSLKIFTEKNGDQISKP